MNELYLEMFARLFLVIGGINYFVMYFFRENMINVLHFPILIRGFIFAIGASALYFIFNRDYYLPFLDKCVMPIGTWTREGNQQGETMNHTTVKLDGLPSNTNVIFWAAQPGKKIIPNPIEAYGDYSNSGMTQSDITGNATIQVKCPTQYSVSKFGIMNKTLLKHVHYRYEIPGYKGMFSRVYTKNVDC